MNLRQKILTGIGFLSAIAFLYGVFMDDPSLRLRTKPIPVLCLITESILHSGVFRRLITTALVLSVVGDIFLEWSSHTFIHGLVAFLCAHIIYSVAFFLQTRRINWSKFIPFILEGGGVFFACRHGMGSLQIPVLVYIFIIALMGTLAATLLEVTRKHDHKWQRWAPVLGASFFVLSDTLIALRKFHFTNSYDFLHYWTITTYWLAQYLITWGAITLTFDNDKQQEADKKRM